MSSKNKTKTRLKPNPMFEKWISEWMAEATEKNLEVRHGYRRALQALQKYPLPLQSGKECLILKFFGKKLCEKIDKRLEQYKNSMNIDRGVDDNVLQQPAIQKVPSKSTTVIPMNIPKPINSTGSSKCYELSNPVVADKIVILPNEFTIILLIDTGETSSLRKTDMSKVAAQLSSLNVTFEMRRLSIGDFAWVCRDSYNNELMLPYIVERKRLDDLSSSILDGRFHEQKFRLKQCGIENKIYLLEMGKKYHGLPLSNLLQGIANTEVVDEFTIIRTENHLESISYIASLTSLLTDMYLNKLLTSSMDDPDSGYGSSADAVTLISFKTFNKCSSKSKNMTVRDMFIRHLLQIRGLSVKKAFAIVEHYPTPISLIKAFRSTRNPLLLASITYGVPSQMVGQIISKTLFQLYSNDSGILM